MFFLSTIKDYYSTKHGFIVISLFFMLILALLFTLLAIAASNWDLSSKQFCNKQSQDDGEDSISFVNNS